MENQGKLVIKGENTPHDESYYLRKMGEKMKEQNDKFERKNEFVNVPITHGYLKVLRKKFEKNEDYYKKISVGYIKFE